MQSSSSANKYFASVVPDSIKIDLQIILKAYDRFNLTCLPACYIAVITVSILWNFKLHFIAFGHSHSFIV